MDNIRIESVELRILLEAIIGDLSSLNHHEQLDGYLDGLADRYNSKLQELGLPRIKRAHEKLISCSISIQRCELYVYDRHDNQVFVKEIGDEEMYLFGYTEEQMLDYIMSNYKDVLQDLGVIE
jgi:hypothetical protein